MTPNQLRQIMPYSAGLADHAAAPLTNACVEFDIYSPLRQAAFIAQIAHESGSLHYVRELASGEAYEHRADLGNVFVGDGRKFRGRGYLQITGRANYEVCGKALNLPLLEQPELLETEINAARSAGWFWQTHGLNALADARLFQSITRAINGGLIGLAERVLFYQKAQQVFGVEP